MRGPLWLTSCASLCVACGHPSPPHPSPPPSNTAPTTVPADATPTCGELTLRVDVYATPHGGSRGLTYEADGRLGFESHAHDGPTTCAASLSLDARRTLDTRIAALELHTLPESIRVPTIRDGLTIVIAGTCGQHQFTSTVRNIFPAPVGALTDLLDEALAAHCEPDARLPTGAELAGWAEATGATAACAEDCAACNTCAAP